MNPQLIADLEAARALVDSPEKWLKGALRRKAQDGSYRLCLVGAIHVANGECLNKRELNTRYACRAAIGLRETDSLAIWNDAPERTHAEVMALFDKAIATERSKA